MDSQAKTGTISKPRDRSTKQLAVLFDIIKTTVRYYFLMNDIPIKVIEILSLNGFVSVSRSISSMINLIFNYELSTKKWLVKVSSQK